MKRILLNRIIFFSKIIIGIFMFSLVSLLHKIDSKELKKDMRALDVIEFVNQTDVAKAFQTGEIFDQALFWLDEHHAALAQDHRNVRDAVVTLLKDVGFTEENVAEVKGRTSSFDARKRFVLLQLMVNQELMSSMGLKSTSHLTVREMLQRFELLTKNNKIRIADSLVDPHFEHFDPSQTPFSFKIEEVSLKDDVIEFLFLEQLRPDDQKTPIQVREGVKVTTKELEGPSLFHLLQGEHDEVSRLSKDIPQLERIRNLYGNIKFDMAQRLVAEDFVRAYKSLTIFGFNFSTQRYPYAVLFFSMLLAIGIVFTVETAIRGSLKFLTEEQHEHFVDAFLDHPIFRVILWGVMPGLSILLSFPAFILSERDYTILYSGAAIVLIMGIISAIRAKSL